MPTKTLPLHTNGHRVWPETSVDVYEPTYISGSFLTACLYACAWCGQYPETRIEPDGVYVDNGPCPVAENGITTVITLNVPSGRIIVDDDLRPVYDGFAFEDENTADYNSKLGQAQVIENFAKIGCAFGPVGNSCPGLYRTGPDTYVIANPAYDAEADEERLPNGWVRLASICTDVWAYSIADHQDWRDKGGNPDKETWADVVEIPAGVYQFTHHTGEVGFDRDSADDIVFAHIKKIG